MAKNEAKIKFTAETGNFNQKIKQANNEMAELRAELKLNATQMKATGTTVEGLENKHKILTAQLKASESKTEALNQKVNKAVEIFGENSEEAHKLKVQLLNAQNAEEKLRQSVNACETELKQQKAAAAGAEDAIEGLTDKVSRQQGELKQLKREYVDAVGEFGEASSEAKDLESAISKLSSELKDNQEALSDAAKKADDLDQSLSDVDGSAAGAGDGFTILKGTIADLASSAIQWGIEKLSEFTSYLAELPAETMELRQDLATLTTSFDNMGFSVETAEGTWKDLYAVFGEDDRAVEASNLIAKMSKNQQDLDDWTTITTGTWAKFQDSLPVEGLAEASMETAKTGKVTGVLADALNWAAKEGETFGVKLKKNTEENEEWNEAVKEAATAEDYFNLALAECSSEQERQQLITNTLKGIYGESAETYRDTAEAQMDAKEAAAEHALAEAEIAEALQPVSTAFTELKTSLLTALKPAIEKVTELMFDALEWAKEHPVAIQAIATAVGVLAIGLTGLAVGLGVYTVAQWAANSAMLAAAAPIIAVIAVIALVVAAIVVLVKKWDDIVAAVKKCWENVKATLAKWGEWINSNVIQPVVKFFKSLWDDIVNACKTAWDWVKDIFSSFVSWVNNNVIKPIVKFFKGLWDSLKDIWNGICDVVEFAIKLIASIISAAFQLITLPFRFIWENCKDTVIKVWNAIKSAVNTAINATKRTIQTVLEAIKKTFTTIWNSIKSVVTKVWNSIKSTVTKAVNAVKSVITKVWNSVKSVTSSAWNSIKSAVTKAVNAVKSVVSKVWNSVKSVTSSVFNSVKSVVSSVWNGIKNTISNIVNGVKSKVSSVFNSMKSAVSSAFNSIRSTASSVWSRIKTAITTPIESAKNKVKSVVDSIKGFFSGMKLSLPKIKLPHFSIKGKLSISPPSVPKLSIKWYKEGGIMLNPTIFGMNGNSLMGGGEAGPEAILPIDKLEGYVENAVEKTMQKTSIQPLINAIEDLANRAIELNINGKHVATATAGDFDSVNGLRSALLSRGLVLE